MMQTHKLPYENTGQFSPLLINYLKNDPSVKEYYRFSPNLESFPEIIREREKLPIDRTLLVQILQEQYQKIPVHPLVQSNIQRLADSSTFTVTTGHQLGIFTGPLYFISKIVSTIHLAKKLNAEFSSSHIVPVFWMASEDHDIEEINHIHIFGKEYKWMPSGTGASGKLNPKGLPELVLELSSLFPENKTTANLLDIFRQGYQDHDNLADATRFIVHELFKEEGLVIIDGNNASLKKSFQPIIEKEIFEKNSYRLISESIQGLEQQYKIQVKPREINFFYLGDQIRERIIENEKADFEIVHTELRYSQTELAALIEKSPELFSPNVVTRPLYQEFILPNLAYIGGPAEVAYWLELKSTFDHYGIFFPAIILRAHAMIIEKNISSKVHKSGLSINDLFHPEDALITHFMKNKMSTEFNVKQYQSTIDKLFEELSEKAISVDSTLKESVLAEKNKVISGLQNLEQKIIRAEKRKHETEINQIKKIKEKLFPGNVLAERKENLLSFASIEGFSLKEELLKHLNPLERNLIIFEL